MNKQLFKTRLFLVVELSIMTFIGYQLYNVGIRIFN